MYSKNLNNAIFAGDIPNNHTCTWCSAPIQFIQTITHKYDNVTGFYKMFKCTGCGRIYT